MSEDFVILEGKKIFLDKNDRLELRIRGVYEPTERAIFRKLIKPGDVVIDVGAHIGFHTLLFSELVGDKGKVLAVEPDKENVEILIENIDENSCDNVYIWPCVAWKEIGYANLYFNEDNMGSTAPGQGTRFVESKAIALSDLVDKVDFIKIDVDGGEGEVIEGMKRLLTKTKPIIWLKERIVLSRGQDYHRVYEPIWFGWKEGQSHYRNKEITNAKELWDLDRLDFEERLDLWYISRDKSADYVHPTQKPIKLIERAMKKSSVSGNLLYEPFSGSGSTLMACEQADRRCNAIDLDPSYVQAAIGRYEEFTGEKAIKL